MNRSTIIIGNQRVSPILRGGGGGGEEESFPSPHYFLNNFFFAKIGSISKFLTENGKNFTAIKATVNEIFPFFCDCVLKSKSLSLKSTKLEGGNFLTPPPPKSSDSK